MMENRLSSRFIGAPSEWPICMGEQGQAENFDAESSRNKGRPLREGGQHRQSGEY